VSSPIWHPFTQHALTPDATLVKAGEGAWLDVAPSGLRIASAASATSPMLAPLAGEGAHTGRPGYKPQSSGAMLFNKVV